ncbi:MAG: hypothetical protein DWQ47_05235 [Acidobacteria bacterium]|nr:MAG: hypothetical protein DWQ32_08785 [Acidobacteriota bacterium]REK14741.1 MAG: hypothetical protein DWQ43_14475 [Acidobacteriota bacterium]REK45456.1 MAG: hypothetical protein DWQ47_05235 [Acidobacteriota bacterium]
MTAFTFAGKETESEPGAPATGITEDRSQESGVRSQETESEPGAPATGITEDRRQETGDRIGTRGASDGQNRRQESGDRIGTRSASDGHNRRQETLSSSLNLELEIWNSSEGRPHSSRLRR